MTEQKRASLDDRLAAAHAAPGMAHLILGAYPGQGPVCSLCGGREAPIIDGKHLNPERWCERDDLPATG